MQLFPRYRGVCSFLSFIIIIIMKFGVPYGTTVNEFSDIEFEYQWFDDESDALAFAKTLDKPYDVINEIITMGS